MGLTGFKGGYVTVGDALIAKNYLSEPELKQLNLIVSLYLDFAELQASNEIAMTMKDWVTKLDEFLRVSGKRILIGSGQVTAEEARETALAEYEKFRKEQTKKCVSDFDEQTKKYFKA